jgi:hypothetical protein
MVTRRFYQQVTAIASWVVIADEQLESGRTGAILLRVLFLIGAAAFVAFWFWALFLADKTAVNKIEDREWAARAEEICAPVKQSVRLLNLEATPELGGRADLVVESTDMLAAMLDDLEAVRPSDPKGQAIVPEWIADYRTLLQDRYNYAERLRSGENVPFTETPVQGIPITERIETFAGDNEMPSCAPPRAGVLG